MSGTPYSLQNFCLYPLCFSFSGDENTQASGTGGSIHALEKEMATHSGVLAWRIPGMGKPGGLPSMGTPVFLPGESMDGGAYGGIVHRMAESDTTEQLTLSLGNKKITTFLCYHHNKEILLK